MAALGAAPAAQVTTAQIEALLIAHAREGVGARSVNKHRQVLAAIFNFGVRPENARRWLSYGIARQRGSHRRLKAPGRPPITFAFHDSATVAPGVVRKILCGDVGLGEDEALKLL